MQQPVSKFNQSNKENSLNSSQKNFPLFKTPLRDEKCSFYCLAKEAEFHHRNLKDAEFYYNLAIENNERVDSAVKDLATVIHQRGRTEEACLLLEDFRHKYHGDMQKYENLIKNLRKQIKPTGNCLLTKLLLIVDPKTLESTVNIRDLFTKSSRILDIERIKEGSYLFKNQEAESSKLLKFGYQKLFTNWKPQISGIYYLVQFSSHSQAKKTLDSLKKPVSAVFWVNSNNKIVTKARKNQLKIQPNKFHAIESIWEETLYFALDIPLTTFEKDDYSKISGIWDKPSPQSSSNNFVLPLFQKAYENKINLDFEFFFKKL